MVYSKLFMNVILTVEVMVGLLKCNQADVNNHSPTGAVESRIVLGGSQDSDLLGRRPETMTARATLLMPQSSDL